MLRRKLRLLPIAFIFFFKFSSASVFAGPDPGLIFIENKNQWGNDVRFAMDVQNGRVNFYERKLQFIFVRYPNVHYEKGHYHPDMAQLRMNEAGAKSDDETFVRGHVYDVRFLGANDQVAVSGENILPAYYNYFLGDDRSKWGSRARSFSAVRYEELYCGIDLLFYSESGNMKYEWIVSPETDPDMIQLAYDGVDQIYIDQENLRIKTSVNEILEYKPYAYQIIGGSEIAVPCEYRLNGKKLSYVFPQGYDPCYELVIDPILIFSAYSGSLQDNWGNTATYDSSGNVYSGGMVTNDIGLTGYPVTSGAFQKQYAGGNWDVGILKYDSAGTQLLYCTYLGGNGTETPQSLVVNQGGDLLVLGATSSNNFPVSNGTTFSGGESIDPLNGVFYGGGSDIFIARISADGSQLSGATYLGGTANDGINFISGDMGTINKLESPLARNYGDQLRGDIITDADDYVYIASNTLSNDFPALNTYGGGSHDAIVVKLQPDLSAVEWARYIGGNGTDAAYSIKITDDKVFVAGGSTSLNLPGMNGLKTTNSGNVDGWVMSLTTDGTAIIDGTYLGTFAYDQAYFIDLNEDGEVYVYGQTKGNYPVTPNVYTNANAGQFVHKLSNDLKATIFSTVVGSSNSSGNINPNISPTAFLVSQCDNLYLSGWGGSVNATTVNAGTSIITRNYVGGTTRNMPVSNDAYQNTTVGSDFYFMVLSADASEFLYGTYLGGSLSFTHVDGGTSRFDKQGIVYHAVCAGCGGNSDFPAVNVPPAHQENNSNNCNNAVFKFDLSLLKARFQTNSVKLDMPGLSKVCMPDEIVFQNRSTGGEIFEWRMGDGNVIMKSDTSAVVHQYETPGKYIVWLKAIDQNTCIGVDSVSKVVDVFQVMASVQDDDDLCTGSSYTLHASGGATYAWSSEDGTFTSPLPEPSIAPEDTTLYFVTVTDANGCVLEDTVQINVIPGIDPQFDLSRGGDCNDLPVIKVHNRTEDAEDATLTFDFGDGSASDLPEDVHAYEKEGTYSIKLTGVREFCVYEKIIQVPVYTVHIPNVITPIKPEGLNDNFVVQYSDVQGVAPADYGLKVSLSVYNRWGREVYSSNDYKNNWAGEGLADGVYYFEMTVEGHETCRSWVHVIR